MPLKNGIPAPKFELPDETGKIHRLSDYRKKTVVLYFYPKDDTPGCTTEACNFRDDYSAYQNADVVILGISPDSPASHAKFKAKFDLPFPLLADEGHKICEQYDVWGLKNYKGREYNGVFRTTYIIDGNGNIQYVYENVRPAEHSAEILKDLSQT